MNDLSRRIFLQLSAAATMLAPFGALGQTSPMKIGIVGAGRIGGTIGTLWAKAGHRVFYSSRHPEELKPLVERSGTNAQAGTVAQAIAFGDVIFIAVPYSALPAIGRDNAAALSGKIVLNASNEVAVAAFLDSRLAFTAIPEVIASAMDRYDAERPGTVRGLDDVRAVDRGARTIAAESAGKVQSKS